MGFEPLQFANLVGGLFGLLLSFAVVRHQRKASEGLFGYLLMCAATAGIAISVEHTDLLRNGLILDQVAILAGYLAGPILLLYIRLVVGARESKWQPLHFLPAALFVGYCAGQQLGLYPWNQPFYTVDIYMAIYAAFAIQAFKGHRRTSLEAIWASRLLVFFILCIVGGVARNFIGKDTWLREVVPTTMTLGFAAFAYFAFAGLFESDRKQPSARRSQPRSDAANRLLDLMSSAKPHRDPDLDLSKLASLAGLRRNELSELLNSQVGCTFAGFVAQYRVQEVIDRLDAGEAEKSTLEAIAFASGFRSRSTFYSAFKSATGLTPSQYLAGKQQVVRSVPIGQLEPA